MGGLTFDLAKRSAALNFDHLPDDVVAVARLVQTPAVALDVNALIQLCADGIQSSGTSRSIASSQARADMSDGARQSPRGESAPPWDTLGPLGRADRLNWLNE